MGVLPVNLIWFLALSFALLLAIATLAREIRLRRALQRLVRQLLSLWRSRAHETDVDARPDHRACHGDRLQ